MDERIKLQVNKMIVHKRIHEYLKDYSARVPLKVEPEPKQQEGDLPNEAHSEQPGMRAEGVKE
jgi:hypothetical protein